MDLTLCHMANRPSPYTWLHQTAGSHPPRRVAALAPADLRIMPPAVAKLALCLPGLES